MKLKNIKAYKFSFKSRALIINTSELDYSKKPTQEENNFADSNSSNSLNNKNLILLKYLYKEKTILKSKQNLLDYIKNKNVLMLFPYPCKFLIFIYLNKFKLKKD